MSDHAHLSAARRTLTSVAVETTFTRALPLAATAVLSTIRRIQRLARCCVAVACCTTATHLAPNLVLLRVTPWCGLCSALPHRARFLTRMPRAGTL